MGKHPGGRPPIHGTATVSYTLRLTPQVRDEFFRVVDAYKAKAAAQNMSANATHVFVAMLRHYQQSKPDAPPATTRAPTEPPKMSVPKKVARAALAPKPRVPSPASGRPARPIRVAMTMPPPNLETDEQTRFVLEAILATGMTTAEVARQADIDPGMLNRFRKGGKGPMGGAGIRFKRVLRRLVPLPTTAPMVHEASAARALSATVPLMPGK